MFTPGQPVKVIGHECGNGFRCVPTFRRYKNNSTGSVEVFGCRGSMFTNERNLRAIEKTLKPTGKALPDGRPAYVYVWHEVQMR